MSANMGQLKVNIENKTVHVYNGSRSCDCIIKFILIQLPIMQVLIVWHWRKVVPMVDICYVSQRFVALQTDSMTESCIIQTHWM